MPCYGYDIAAAGGAMSIRYALVRHRHNKMCIRDSSMVDLINNSDDCTRWRRKVGEQIDSAETVSYTHLIPK